MQEVQVIEYAVCTMLAWGCQPREVERFSNPRIAQDVARERTIKTGTLHNVESRVRRVMVRR
jgi:hypothetical protein